VVVVGNKSAATGRQFVKEAYLPRIGVALSSADKVAVQQIGTQQGWFLRGQNGLRADNLTARGREIVESGLKSGLGTEAIGQNLKLAMPDLWNKYGNNYANVCASVAVNRARSHSAVNGYLDAGIEFAEIVAVLDERTTEQCRALDGEIIPTDKAAELLNAGANVKTPEDIYTTNPFLHTATNADGVKQIVTANGVVVSDILRSGYGRVDDRGEHRKHLMGEQLLDAAAIGMPPYHHL
jgi:hypothetical protein